MALYLSVLKSLTVTSSICLYLKFEVNFKFVSCVKYKQQLSPAARDRSRQKTVTAAGSGLASIIHRIREGFKKKKSVTNVTL